MLPQQGGLWDSTGLCCSLEQSLVPGVQAQELPQGLAWTAAPWLGKSPANDPGHCPGSPGVGLEHLGLLHLRISPGEGWICRCGSSSGTAWAGEEQLPAVV